MRRRVAIGLAVACAFWIGHAIGDRPDDRLRAEAGKLLENTAAFGETCHRVLDENIRLTRLAAERGFALDG